MVTWGQNTTFTLPAAGSSGSSGGGGFSFGGVGAPASSPGGGSLFGAPAPSSGGGLFGGAAPAPAGAFSFGSPAPAPGGLFGGSGFGSTSTFGAPAPVGGGLFGQSTGGGLFGQSAGGGGLFGQPYQQQQQQQQAPAQPQIPAQAALQAHMNASARIEEDRVQQHLLQLNNAYTYIAPAKSDLNSSDFCEIVYNPATPEYQQQQWLHGLGVDGRARLVLPPNKPPQVAQREWEHAAVRNPDRQQFMPIALVGATALQARLTGQQEQVNVILKQLETLKGAHDVTRDRYERARANLNTMAIVQDQQRKRLMDIMRRVEVTRCYNNPLQADEIKAMQKAVELYRQVEQLAAGLRVVEDQARTAMTQQPVATTAVQMMGTLPDKEQLKAVLKEHRSELAKCTTMLDKDMRDLHLISQRVKSVSGSR